VQIPFGIQKVVCRHTIISAMSIQCYELAIASLISTGSSPGPVCLYLH